MKQFEAWLPKKSRLHDASHRPPLVSEGDIWWAALGENIGSEVNGKSALFSRPVIIYKKLAHGFYLVIPTSTKEKMGSWYVSFFHQTRKNVACLHQVRSLDYRRLYGKIGSIDDADFLSVKEGFLRLFG